MIEKVSINNQISQALAEIQDEQGQNIIEAIDRLQGWIIENVDNSETAICHLRTLHLARQWLIQLHCQ